MRLKQHTLSIFFGVIFIVAPAGQSVAGLAVYNEEQLAHGAATTTWLASVTSSDSHIL